jgi:hypothetical protein
MRTPARVVRQLLKEAADALNCPVKEVWTRGQGIAEAVTQELGRRGYGAVIVSPYKDCTWGIYAIRRATGPDGKQLPSVVAERFLPVAYRELVEQRERIIEEFCEAKFRSCWR